jgi:hypothetical protein
MPWKPSDASSKTHKAKTAVEKRQWAHIANAELKRTGDDALAIRAANSVIAKRHGDGSGHWSGH